MEMPRKTEKSATTPRSILIGLVMVIINCYWIMMSFFFGSGESGTITLMYNVVFSVLVLNLANSFLFRHFPKFSLKQSELLTVYVMLTIASVLASHFTIQVLVPIIPHAYQFATAENEWQNLFWRYIPNWLTIDNPKVFTDFYRGESTLYTMTNIQGWLEPILWWTTFLSALLLATLGLNIIFRKQWTEQEKLSYPLIQLPLEMTSTESGLFRNRLMWACFIFSFGINVLNGLHFIWPVVPSVISGQQYDISRFFPQKPFSAIGWTPIAIYPFAIGIAFLMPLDLSFSCWCFYLLWKGQKIFGSMMGFAGLPVFPYADEQSFGAYLGLGLLAIWITRKHLREVAINVISKHTDIEKSNETIGYRIAVSLVIISSFFLMGFCHFSGMSMWAIVIFFLLYFLLSISFTRIRAESGILFHDLHFMGPDSALTKILGTRSFSPSDLTMFSFLYFFNRAHTSNPMPYQLESFKIAERASIADKKFMIAMLLVIPFGSLASFWAYLHGVYQFGSNGSFGWGPFNRLQRWFVMPTQFDSVSTTFVTFGICVTMLLTFLRWRFLWWPLSPIGYAVSGSYTMNIFWLSFLIGWVLKRMLLTQGGLKTYRQMIPLFFGLILGEFAMGSFWSISSIIFQRPMYDFID